MAKLKKVKAVSKYKLHLEYSDGVSGVHDVEHLKSQLAFHSIFEKGEFEKVSIDKISNDIAWNCGPTLCRNAIYKQLQLKSLLSRLHIDPDKI